MKHTGAEPSSTFAPTSHASTRRNYFYLLRDWRQAQVKIARLANFTDVQKTLLLEEHVNSRIQTIFQDFATAALNSKGEEYFQRNNGQPTLMLFGFFGIYLSVVCNKLLEAKDADLVEDHIETLRFMLVDTESMKLRPDLEALLDEKIERVSEMKQLRKAGGKLFMS